MLTPRIVSDQTRTLTLDGRHLALASLANAAVGRSDVAVSDESEVIDRVASAAALVAAAVADGKKIYGVTTGFGGMADEAIPCDLAAVSQSNLLNFLAAGAGEPIDDRHTRAAMLLRANVLLQGCSGARLELIQRLVTFVHADAIPVVRELGSIGASGDLIPLASIARAITGADAKVRYKGQTTSAKEVLSSLGLQPLQLLPKEGLALINGTSFSAAIAANVVAEAQRLFALTVGVQSMMLRALVAHVEPFGDFVHQKKPHAGQVWVARVMKDLLTKGATPTTKPSAAVQDRYSLRCLPQYLGPIAEGIARAAATVETEMNSVSDNPLVDVESGGFHQSGNFLGQYIAISMDEMRQHIGLMAKHLDVQLATLVTPEFSGGLPASLRGNSERPYNMGLKGLQITANSIMPMLTWHGNPITTHFPTHAEQYNQNINGLSWGSANLAWRSIKLFRQYLATSLIAAVQACDLRAKEIHGNFDGRQMLGPLNQPLYEAVCQVTGVAAGEGKPFLFDDSDRSLESDLESLASDIELEGDLCFAVENIERSFESHFDRTS